MRQIFQWGSRGIRASSLRLRRMRIFQLFLRKGAAEAVGGLLGYFCGSLVFRRQGVKIHPRVHRAGHYVLSVAHFFKDPSRSLPCPGSSASSFHIALQAPDLSDGDLS